MQFTNVLVLCALLPALGLAAPAGSGSSSAAKSASKTGAAKAAATSGGATNGNNGGNQQNNNGGNQNGNTTNVSQTQIANAVDGWKNDTGKVSNFLNTATSLTGDDYTQAATIAYNAEVDELNHKAVLDAAMGGQPAVQAANDTLATQGTFQAVVDSLAAMVAEGPDTAQSRVNEINNNRCVNVLPNINAYFAAAGSSASTASVPTGCLDVAATNTGSVVPPSGAVPAPANGAGQTTSAASSSSTSTSAAGNNGGNNGGNGGAATSSSTSSSSSAARGGAGAGNGAAKATTTAAKGGNNAQSKATPSPKA